MKIICGCGTEMRNEEYKEDQDEIYVEFFCPNCNCVLIGTMFILNFEGDE